MTHGKEWSRDDVRGFDQRLIGELGIPAVVLMENAGRGAADWILSNLDRLGCQPGFRVCVLCGKGNNGGDGATYNTTKYAKQGDLGSRVLQPRQTGTVWKRGGTELTGECLQVT